MLNESFWRQGDASRDRASSPYGEGYCSPWQSSSHATSVGSQAGSVQEKTWILSCALAVSLLRRGDSYSLLATWRLAFPVASFARNEGYLSERLLEALLAASFHRLAGKKGSWETTALPSRPTLEMQKVTFLFFFFLDNAVLSSLATAFWAQSSPQEVGSPSPGGTHGPPSQKTQPQLLPLPHLLPLLGWGWGF